MIIIKIITAATMLATICQSRHFNPAHHTSYGAPFAVPSHGSRTFLSPMGANSLASVMQSLGVGPGGQRISSTRQNPANNIPNNSPPTEFGFSKSVPGQIPGTGNAPLTQTANEVVVPRTQNHVALNANSVRLLNDIFNNVIPTSAGSASQFSGLSQQTPFVVILPQGNRDHTNQPQPTQLILNPDVSASLPNGVTTNPSLSEILTGMNINGANVNSITPQILRLSQNSIPGSSPATNNVNDPPVFVLLDPAHLQGPETVNSIGTNAPNNNAVHILNELIKSSTPVHNNQQPNAVPTTSTGATDQTVTQGAIGGLPPFPGQETSQPSINNPSLLNTQGTQEIALPTNTGTGISTNNQLSTNTGSPTNQLPNGASSLVDTTAGISDILTPPPSLAAGPEPSPIPGVTSEALNAANPAAKNIETKSVSTVTKTTSTSSATASANGNTAATADTIAIAGDIPPTAAAEAQNNAQTAATKMVIPVISDLTSLGKGTGGVYMYSFSIAGTDGITRHETGKVEPGLKTISKSFSPGTSFVNSATNTGAPTGIGLGAAIQPANIHGNYSYLEPTGKVFKVQYSHGEPTYMPAPPPPPITLPYSAAHPFDFLVKKLTKLNTKHNVVPGAATLGSLNAAAGNTGQNTATGVNTPVNRAINSNRGGSTVL